MKLFENISVVNDVKEEDNGLALIFESDETGDVITDNCVFVRVQSWDDDKQHPLLRSLIGKKIKITLEEI